jgi:hypothetical protein
MSAATAPAGARRGSRTARATRDKPRLVSSAVAIERLIAADEQVPAQQREPLLLDVRDAPMSAQAGWTLAVLESLEIGRRVLHVNTAVPWFLFPMLETRGTRYEIQSREDGDVRILMWRHCEPSGVWPCGMRVERIRVL